MVSRSDGSHKRTRTPDHADLDAKKPRRSERLSQRVHSTASVSFVMDDDDKRSAKEATATPPEGRLSQVPRGTPGHGLGLGVRGTRARHAADPTGLALEISGGSSSSPTYDTQALPSQPLDPNAALSDEVQDEVQEGVWGYLVPVDAPYGSRSLVLKKRDEDGPKKKGKKKKDKNPTGFLIGRHAECDHVINDPLVSNRHCLIFAEHTGNSTVAVLEDLSANGTFVNDAIVGRNNRRELKERDEVAVLDKARYVFRYPRSRATGAFEKQYEMQRQLGKGQYGTVFLCTEKATGQQFAVKVVPVPREIEDDAQKVAILKQEIAVLMGINHPNVASLKDTFHENGKIYIVLEFVACGELFEHIISRNKFTEDETRKVFRQLFAGIKYLHERNIVHRDIKPENVLVADPDLHVKLADFGLAKIVGEESFLTTLCGTPSYVAPEVITKNRPRAYTKAVDIWSLGVVLYICLCGFPPFSDECQTPEFPYNMTEQILGARFSYPSPYWDMIGDPALDLIDNMITVDPNRRFTVDQCLAHPWMTATSSAAFNLTDSTDGLVGGVAGLQVDRRNGSSGSGSGSGAGMARERTLISVLHRAQIREAAAAAAAEEAAATAAAAKGSAASTPRVPKEMRPADYQQPRVFMELGDVGDPILYQDNTEDDEGDLASTPTMATAQPKKAKGKGKTKR